LITVGACEMHVTTSPGNGTWSIVGEPGLGVDTVGGAGGGTTTWVVVVAGDGIGVGVSVGVTGGVVSTVDGLTVGAATGR
jgi:hypothetical protein